MSVKSLGNLTTISPQSSTNSESPAVSSGRKRDTFRSHILFQPIEFCPLSAKRVDVNAVFREIFSAGWFQQKIKAPSSALALQPPVLMSIAYDQSFYVPSKPTRPHLSFVSQSFQLAQESLSSAKPSPTIAQILYPRVQTACERQERYAVAKDLRFLMQAAKKLKELTTKEGHSTSTEAFKALDALKVRASSLTVSLGKLKEILQEYAEALIAPSSQLLESRYQEMRGLIQTYSSDLALKLDQTRMRSAKYWESCIHREGLKLGELKLVHAGMVRVLETVALFTADKPLSEVRKALLSKQFALFFKNQPSLDLKAQDLSDRLVHLMQESQLERPTLPLLRAAMAQETTAHFSQERIKFLLLDLAEKTKDVDQHLAFVDLLLAKDGTWFQQAASDNVGRIRDLAELVSRAGAKATGMEEFLNQSVTGQLNEETLNEVKAAHTFLKSSNEQIADSLKGLASEYWSHQNAILQEEIDVISHSPHRKDVVDDRTWNYVIVGPSRLFFEQVAAAFNGDGLTSEIVEKQREFVPLLLTIKKDLAEVNETEPKPRESKGRFFWHTLKRWFFQF